MAFTTEPQKLYDEINNAIDRRDEKLTNLSEMIASMHTKAYDGKAAVEESTVNHAGIWLSVMLPRLVHRNPKTLVKTRKAMDGAQGEIEQHAEALQAFLNVWVKSENLASKLKTAAVEYSFVWCFGMVTRKKHPGDPTMDTAAERYLPEYVPISPWRCIVDPYCQRIEDARFVGHMWHCDKDDLLEQAKAADEDEGWNVGLIERMSPENKSLVKTQHDERDGKVLDRNEVQLVDIWIPEKVHDEDVGPEDGFHGTLMTLGWDANEESAAHIREPRPYYGPPSGPYAMGGYMSVPKQVWPLGPLTLTRGHENLMREMVGHANRSCSEYRKVVLVPGGTDLEAAAKQAAVGRNQIITVPGMPSDAKPVVVEIGGVTDQQLRNIAYTRSELERMSGLDAAAQGEVTGDGTATEHALADQAMQTISGHIIDNFHEFVRQVLQKVAWYGFADDEIKMPLDADGADVSGFEMPVFVGGPGDMDMRAFRSFTVDIEPTSMERVNDAMNQQRMMQAISLIGQLLPMVRQFPEVDWDRLFTVIGDTMNMPDFGSLVDLDMASQLMGVPAQGGGSTPGLGIDAGFGNTGGQERQTVGKMMGSILSQAQGVA